MSKKTNDDVEVFACGLDSQVGSRHPGLWRVFWGLFFLVAAAAVALSTLGIFTLSGINNIGWLVLAIFLLALAIASLFKLNWFGLFLPLAGIATIANYQTDYLSISGDNIAAVWIVAVMLSIGFTILFHRSWRSKYRRHYRKRHGKTSASSRDADNEVYVNASLGSTVKYIDSDDFQRAVLKCELGSITAYFDNAKIKGDNAEIVIDGSLSGFVLYIPKDWRLVNNTRCSLGGVSESNRSSAKATKTVTLTGNLDLSGVEITYV